jgi:hypothetical protein
LNTITQNKRQDTKKRDTFIALSFFIIAIAVHHHILILQNRYCLEIGPGDKDYFTVNKRNEFGLRYGSEWVRDMRRRSYIHLPLTFQGKSVRLGFEINSYSHFEKVLISNVKKEVIAGFDVPAGKNSTVYYAVIPTDKLPGAKLEIKLSSGGDGSRQLDLELNRIYIETDVGGTSLPWINDLLFLFSIIGFWVVLCIAGFSFFQGLIGTGIFALLIIIARFIDPLSYLSYLRSFLLLGLPFLLFSVFFIRFVLLKISLFKGESARVISALFLIGFIVHFVGIFFPYHLNVDGNLRVGMFRLMEKNGLAEYLGEMSRQHSARTGIENRGIPYPPWYNLLALPFVRMGISDHLWLRFQFLMIGSFYLLLIYGLARQLGLSENVSRLASLFSIFGTGVLCDITNFAYDPVFSFTLSLLFFIAYFNKAEKLSALLMKEKLKLGAILGLALILHPSILLLSGMFFAIALILIVFSRVKKKWNAAASHMEIGLIGFVLSLFMFYGLFLRDLLTVTVPNAMKNSAVSEISTGNGGLSNIFFKIIQRILNMIPAVLLLFFIYGFFLLLRQLKKNKMNWPGVFIVSWALVYFVIVIFRATGMFFNFIKYVPEYEFIYPIVFIASAYGFSELYRKFKNISYIRFALISIVFLNILLNLLWFYCVSIGMAPHIERFIGHLILIL